MKVVADSTDNSLTPPVSRLSGDISMSPFSHEKQVIVRLIVSFVLQDRISCTHNKHLTREVGNGQTSLEMQDWLQMPSIPTSTEIDKDKDGYDITLDVDTYLRDDTSVPDYSGDQCNNWTCV